jgi:hypothetical protein
LSPISGYFKSISGFVQDFSIYLADAEEVAALQLQSQGATMSPIKLPTTQSLFFLLIACYQTTAFTQVSVVPATGIAPRFPKSEPELLKQTKPPSRQWLLDANDDAERFRRLELWGSAGDLEMQNIAHRLQALHASIQKESWDLAIYHLEKMKGRMTVVMLKRPTRTQNMEAVFLESGVYKTLHDALTSRKSELARSAFQGVRQACMNCHVAEKLGFLNDSAVFRQIDF